MATYTKLIRLVLLAMLGAVPVYVFGAKCAGSNINNSVTWTPADIVKGSTTSILRITSVTVSDDPSAPYHLVSGECVGAYLGAPEGKVRISGFCARKDKDGDVLYEEWTSGGGGMGSSKFIGGTGKFAKTTGAFNWQHTPLYGTTAVVRWSGECQ